MLGAGKICQHGKSALIVAQMHYRRWQGCICETTTQPHWCGSTSPHSGDMVIFHCAREVIDAEAHRRIISYRSGKSFAPESLNKCFEDQGTHPEVDMDLVKICEGLCVINHDFFPSSSSSWV